MYLTLQKNLTTSTPNEDIVPVLKALSECAVQARVNAGTPFVISKLIFHTLTNTDVKVNGATNWSDLRHDPNDNLYKCELETDDVKVQSFVVKDSGTSYHVDILY